MERENNMLKIVVCAKAVPDPKEACNIKIDPVTKTLLRCDVPLALNTLDRNALEAALKIKAEQDGSLTFRRSCRHAICGSCAMNVNGHNILVCKTPLRTQLDGQGKVTIRPLPYLPLPP